MMLRRLRLLGGALRLHKALLLVIWAALIGTIGTVASVSQLRPPHPWALRTTYVLAVFYFAFFVFSMFNALRVPYSDFWPTTKSARKWIRPKLQGERPYLMGHANVRTVTVIGVACTDIAYLFSEVVQALSAGISFRVIMVDRNHADVSNEGVLSHWEDRNLVRKEVIEPLAKQLGELRTKFENIANIKVQISQLLSSIDELDAKQELSQHSVCIRVCKKLWELADAHAKTIRSEAGTVSIYLDNELPFARQWVFGNGAVLYSA